MQLTDTNELLVANGEVLSGASVDSDPRISAAEAHDIALGKIANDRNARSADLKTTDPELWVYDPALLGAPGSLLSRLVWRMDVTPDGLDYFRELVLVDAHTGDVALNFDQVHTALARGHDPRHARPDLLLRA